MQTHMGENASMSDVCEMVTQVRSACEKRLSLNASGNIIKCSECDFVCRSKVDLFKHLTSHSIYACDKCDYRNNSAQGLNGHLKIHNDKKFKCSKCDFKGTSINTLNNHMKTHMGDEIFSPASGNPSQSIHSSKRELSISPEKNDVNKNGKNNTLKKSKTLI